MAYAYVTRSETFSSAHRLHSPHLSVEENTRIFGPCNNDHGHNYTVKITIRGKIDAKTGMVMNISDLKRCMKEAFIDLLDHKHLDNDVEYFRNGVVSTTENLAVFIYDQMLKALSDEHKPLLYNVEIRETDKNVVSYPRFLGNDSN